MTDLMRQYQALKAQQPGALLLFQIGDFYETFEEDAKIVSQVLGITLTKRNNGAAGDVPLAGFPIKALDTYLPKLVEAGYRVAICEQTENPRKAKGIVKREIVDMVTPAVHWMPSAELEAARYLAAFWAYDKNSAALALADVAASGRVLYYAGPIAQIENLLVAFAPPEVLVYEGQDTLLPALYAQATHVEPLASWYFDVQSLPELFREVYGYELPPIDQRHLAPEEGATLTALLVYLRSLRQTSLPHLLFPRRLPMEEYFVLDPITVRSLEILAPLTPDGKSLLQVIEPPATSAGRRLLRQWLVMPLRRLSVIEERLHRLEVLYKAPEQFQLWYEALKEVGDVERRIARLSAKRSQPRELAQLYWGLKKLPELYLTLPSLWQTIELEVLQTVLSLLEHYLALSPAPPHIAEKVGEGQVIRYGLDAALDRARDLMQDTEGAIAALREEEQHRTGIRSLKVATNRHIGYYIEVPPNARNRVPPDYRLRQNLPTGGQRYTNDKLEALAAQIASAEAQIADLEIALYQELLEKLHPHLADLQKVAHWVASLDATLALARTAYLHQYVRPTFTQARRLTIRKGRHPVIERFLPPHQPYQPNDLHLSEDTQIYLLTGPNMAGKSAYMRQNALILLLAHVGSFVPAEAAELPLVDQIFSRIGASDNLAAGQSTFWVEMTETARILHQATSHSFVIIDEVGRGTSTYDGLAIAWSLLEYLHQQKFAHPWVLFATHYHELTELEKALPHLKNYHLAVEERGGKLIFLYTLRPGPIRRSFGISVAEKAGLPHQVITRAKKLLKILEKQQPLPSLEPTLFYLPPTEDRIFVKKLLDMDLTTITPIEALFRLQELQNLARSQ
jgi:DNA mismatch repair protein MutS